MSTTATAPPIPAAGQSRRKLLAIAVGAAVAALLLALAAGLGGLDVLQIGAEDEQAGSYDGGVTVSWDDRDYDAAAGQFVVGGLTLTPTDPGTPFPVGHELDVVVVDTTGAVLHRAPAVEVTSGTSISVTLPSLAIADLGRVAVALEEPSV